MQNYIKKATSLAEENIVHDWMKANNKRTMEETMWVFRSQQPQYPQISGPGQRGTKKSLGQFGHSLSLLPSEFKTPQKTD